MRRKSLLLFIAALIAVPVLTGPTRAGATVSAQQGVMEFNYCGVKCNDGAINPAIYPTIASAQPSVLLLEEICSAQVADIQANSGWTFAGEAFVAKESNLACPGDHQYGDAVLSHEPMTDQDSETFSIGTQQIVCGRTSASGVPVEACGTHLDNDLANAEQQLPEAVDFAEAHATDVALVFGGDLNLHIHDAALDNVYWEGGANPNGDFQELDQCPAPDYRVGRKAPGGTCDRVTHRSDAGNYRKLDYVFLKRSYVTNFSAADPADFGPDVSDHYVFYGDADFCSDSTCDAAT